VIASFAGDVQPAQTKNRQTIKLSAAARRGFGHDVQLVTADTRVWFNPDLRSRINFDPASR